MFETATLPPEPLNILPGSLLQCCDGRHSTRCVVVLRIYRVQLLDSEDGNAIVRTIDRVDEVSALIACMQLMRAVNPREVQIR
jgi:hypothetical protein